MNRFYLSRNALVVGGGRYWWRRKKRTHKAAGNGVAAGPPFVVGFLRGRNFEGRGAQLRGASGAPLQGLFGTRGPAKPTPQPPPPPAINQDKSRLGTPSESTKWRGLGKAAGLLHSPICVRSILLFFSYTTAP